MSAKKYWFVSHHQKLLKEYCNDDNTTKVFVDSNGRYHRVGYVPVQYMLKYDWMRLHDMYDNASSGSEIKRRYADFGQKNGHYFLRDAFDYDGHFEDAPYHKVFSSFKDYVQYIKSDEIEYNEELQEYGEWVVDFRKVDTGEYHTPNHLTLKDLLEFDYSDYFTSRYTLDKDFYEKFIAFGGKLPEQMTVTDVDPDDFMGHIKYQLNPYVTVFWSSDEDRNTSLLYQGINELKSIADKYNVTSEDIRIIFAFNS